LPNLQTPDKRQSPVFESTVQDFDNVIVLSFDVEWASDIVVADVVAELDERGLIGTFFCTHKDINVSGHERGLHPNFRRDGDTIRLLKKRMGVEFDALLDDDIIQLVVEESLKYCPEAIGLRTHSLFFELKLLSIMKKLNLAYDSSCLLPIQSHIKPFSAMWGVTEIPIYYMDHMDLVNGQTNFQIQNLKLGQKGLKVFNFHPNLIYLNAESDDRYQHAKPFYTDPNALLKHRFDGVGTRSLFLDLLDDIATQKRPTMTMADVSANYEKDR
jgi:hypothetical protein